jgi:hypothetical protein
MLSLRYFDSIIKPLARLSPLDSAEIMTLSPDDPEILHRRCRKRKPAGESKIPCSKLQGIFDRTEYGLFMIRSLTPPQAAGNALAFAVQPLDGAGADDPAR